MQLFNQKKTICNRRTTVIFVCAFFALLTGPVHGQELPPKTFSSAEEGVRSLFLAVEENNEDAITGILGSGEDLVSSDSEDQNRSERARFVQKYREMHRLVRETNGTTVLYLGAENWPFPVPLISEKGAWRFDAKAGAAEIRFRRIGENEEAAIEASHLLVHAETGYKAKLHGGDLTSHYALRFAATNGADDGLYSGDDSPIPEFVAAAGVSDTVSQDENHVPYAGYYFRILTEQGKDALGGTQNYISNGTLSGGFAFVAYPAEYGSSGVMTFIVGQDNVVYQKDLGPGTPAIVNAMSRYNPGAGWRPAE
jgi:hypothetical protein